MRIRRIMFLLGIMLAIFSLSLVPNQKDTKKMVLHLKGMQCVDCATIIEETLPRIKGIEKAKIDLHRHHVLIEYNERAICPGIIAAAVDKVGLHTLKKYHHKKSVEKPEKEIFI
ncbi:hypothetical protein GF406_03815 [candidate division KSB1 bacterium]|nr:hypothetical protein [candidate division KSB1 bacterium]